MVVDNEHRWRHLKNWRQERKVMKEELARLMAELHKQMTKREDIAGTAKRRKQELMDMRIAEKNARMRPIFAIFRSFGESIPPGEAEEVAIDAEVLHSRRAKLRLWTGLKDLDQFVADAGWETHVVKAGPVPTFNHRERLLIFLITLRKGFSFSHITLLLGFEEEHSARRIFVNILEELQPWSRRHMTFPDLNTWRRRTPPDFAAAFPGVLMFIADGTPLPCFTFSVSAARRVYWNHKHTMEAKCVTLVTTPDGGLVYVTPTVPGSTHDREAWNESGIASLLARHYASYGQDNSHMAIGGDKGYPGIHIPFNWTLYLPQSTRNFPYRNPPDLHLPRHGNYQPGIYCPRRIHSQMNAAFAPFRRVVEVSIAFFKDNKLLVNPDFVHWQDELLDKTLQFTGALFNFNLYNVPTYEQ